MHRTVEPLKSNDVLHMFSKISCPLGAELWYLVFIKYENME